jgi:hypothetical protein
MGIAASRSSLEPMAIAKRGRSLRLLKPENFTWRSGGKEEILALLFVELTN